MKSYQLVAPNAPLELVETETPEPQGTEVLVKITACGVCHSDLHAMTGSLPQPAPVVLGHEGAGVITAVGGVVLGTISAQHKDTWIDNVIRILSYAGVVTPAFIFAIVFLLIFGLALDWLPSIGRLSEGIPKPPVVTGMITVDALLAGQFSTFWDAFQHLIMPAVALALGSLAQEARITRSTMADNLTKDYIAAERALGIPDRVVMTRFLLKPSLIPTVSIFALDFAANLANAFLVELIFNWPGLSRYGVNAMLRKDLNAITAVILILGVIFIIMNILVDLVVSALDPRIRLRAARSD